MPIEVRVDIEPIKIMLNNGSEWHWLPNEKGPSLLEIRDKQSNVVAVFPKDRVVYVRVINDSSQQQELSSKLEKDRPSGIELTEDTVVKEMISISNPRAAKELIVNVVKNMAAKGMISISNPRAAEELIVNVVKDTEVKGMNSISNPRAAKELIVNVVKNMAAKGMISISNPRAAEELLVNVVKDMAVKGMNSIPRDG